MLAHVVDAVVIERRGLADVRSELLALLGVFVLRAILTVVSDAIAFEAGAGVVTRVRAMLVSHVVALGPAWTRLERNGAVTGTIQDAVESIARYYSLTLPQTAIVAFVPLAILAFVIPTDWVSGLIMLISAPLIPLFMVILGRGTEALNQAQWRTLARLGGRLFDAIEGLTTLKLFNASRAEIEAIAAMSDAYRRETMAVLRIAFLSSLVLEFFATVSVAMVAVYVGFRLYAHDMHFLPGFTVLLLAPEYFRVLRASGTQYHTRMEAIGAAEAIVALLETPIPVIADQEVPPVTDIGLSDTTIPRVSDTTIPRVSDTGVPRAAADEAGEGVDHVRCVRFERVSFSHGDAPVLDAIDLTLQRGRCVALVGTSGAGKTTLAQVLLGFLAPSSGRVTVDGVDLDLVGPEAWRRRVAWLPQRPTLFHGTVLDNLRLGRPDADPASVRRAIERAGASALVAGLPDGLATMLGDRGQGLSGGEIQRLGLARAFLKDADVVVLDEPDAGLDDDAIAHVARSIRAVCRESATLLIAHRVETVRQADEIVLLEGGRIVDRGGYEELVGRGGRAATLIGAATGRAA